MLRKLLYDSSSADVRAHVVKGLVIMLDCKQTHTLLEKMIPLTNKVLHDPHEKVVLFECLLLVWSMHYVLSAGTS